MKKQKLLLSMSGGLTSGYMVYYALHEWPERHLYDMKVVFANTGLEHPGTLRFLKQCEERWGINIVWVEARHRTNDGAPISKKGWAVRHQVVNYFTAARCRKLVTGDWAWTPFEEMISCLGIPSTKSPFCSPQLKKEAIEDYLKSIGWKDYWKAIGIRVDEIDRINENFRAKKIKYLLVNPKPTFKRDVVAWWDRQGFTLDIPGDLGNCTGCWKKSFKRLVSIAKEHPDVFDWWQYITDKYRYFMPLGRVNPKVKPPFNFYRGNMQPSDIFEIAKLQSDQLDVFTENERLDGCSESCEVTF